MGREVKRVSLDFAWPLGKPWEGYIRPFYKDCPKCSGSGATTAMERLSDIVLLLMLSGGDAMGNKCHPYFHETRLFRTRSIFPSKDMAILTSGLAGREPFFFGHGALDCWSAIKKIIRAAGLDPEIWGKCETCKGEGIDPTDKKQYDSWVRTGPLLGRDIKCGKQSRRDVL